MDNSGSAADDLHRRIYGVGLPPPKTAPLPPNKGSGERKRDVKIAQQKRLGAVPKETSNPSGYKKAAAQRA